MTPFDRFVQYLVRLSFDPWIFVKILFLVGLLIYLCFAVIVIRQVDLMTKALNGEFETPLKLISWVHLLVALGVFLLALVIL